MQPIIDRETRRQMLEQPVLVGISELTKAAKITVSQLRYWEKKGYIEPIQVADGAHHKFDHTQVVRAMIINHLTREGYTLAKAAEMAFELSKLIVPVRDFLEDRPVELATNRERPTLILGPFDPEPDKMLIAVHYPDGWKFELDPHIPKK
ncbi:MerR family transcriptional regulator [Levilactobacillus bambusae]|uniref:HTH merR-type domain-containing protein n=1 Tax=Levilactobacillus bambusae TaxID=2024736 RepID=A0A2V1MZ09_9LACO|nr:MerR family transcriptional regulator [Levilactobacillus bambusae]PWG00003.1 hypothetical protein DCM90_03425 [Levilactobacillus bambusae]